MSVDVDVSDTIQANRLGSRVSEVERAGTSVVHDHIDAAFIADGQDRAEWQIWTRSIISTADVSASRDLPSIAISHTVVGGGDSISTSSWKEKQETNQTQDADHSHPFDCEQSEKGSFCSSMLSIARLQGGSRGEL